MNETQPYYQQLQPPNQGLRGLGQCNEPIRKPAVSAALDQLEKQLAELGEQWGRCSQKISPVVSPFPCSPPSDCCENAPKEAGATLALRISNISRTAKNICDGIRETTNQIEL